MKKNLLSVSAQKIMVMSLLCLSILSCDRDDSVIKDSLSVNRANGFIVLRNNKAPSLFSITTSSNLPTCSSPDMGEKKSWGNYENAVLQLHPNIGTNKKYIWRASNISPDGRIPQFKFRVRNKANYPITIRAVALKKTWYGSEYGWKVINPEKCIDLNNQNDEYTIYLPSVDQNYDYIDFEVILMNRDYAYNLTGLSQQLNRNSVPVSITMCRWLGSTPCNGF